MGVCVLICNRREAGFIPSGNDGMGGGSQASLVLVAKGCRRHKGWSQLHVVVVVRAVVRAIGVFRATGRRGVERLSNVRHQHDFILLGALNIALLRFGVPLRTHLRGSLFVFGRLSLSCPCRLLSSCSAKEVSCFVCFVCCPVHVLHES